MKLDGRLSREFTTTEKILLGILAVLLILVVYFYAVDMPLRNQEQNLNSQKASLTVEADALEAKVAEYRRMKQEIENMPADTPSMESYNNRTNEINFLNDLLANTANYSVGFSPVTVSGNQVRRDFTITYTCASYAEAMDLFSRLVNCKYRVLVKDASCSSVDSGTALDGAVSVSATATFYETLVDKTTDAGLPAPEPAAVTPETVEE
ncbi:MAG: type II secretion system protein M [Lachnospiraceae bacterium]|nr:type II secretion system protein M [Lachnospiraceae bacterium]